MKRMSISIFLACMMVLLCNVMNTKADTINFPAVLPTPTADFKMISDYSNSSPGTLQYFLWDNGIKIVKNSSVPIKSVWANYTRTDNNGQNYITPLTTYIGVVMQSGTVALPTTSSISYNLKHFYFNIYNQLTNNYVEFATNDQVLPTDPVIDQLRQKANAGKYRNQIFEPIIQAPYQYSDSDFTIAKVENLTNSSGGDPVLFTQPFFLGFKTHFQDGLGNNANAFATQGNPLPVSSVTLTPMVNDITDGDQTITGKLRQIGDTINVTNNGTPISTQNISIDNTGNFTITLVKPAVQGQSYSVTETESITTDSKRKDSPGTLGKKVQQPLTLSISPSPLQGMTKVNGTGANGKQVQLMQGTNAIGSPVNVAANGTWSITGAAADNLKLQPGSTYYVKYTGSATSSNTQQLPVLGFGTSRPPINFFNTTQTGVAGAGGAIDLSQAQKPAFYIASWQVYLSNYIYGSNFTVNAQSNGIAVGNKFLPIYYTNSNTNLITNNLKSSSPILSSISGVNVQPYTNLSGDNSTNYLVQFKQNPNGTFPGLAIGAADFPSVPITPNIQYTGQVNLTLTNANQ